MGQRIKMLHVDRSRFVLDLYRPTGDPRNAYKLIRSYSIAVGSNEFPTPTGFFTIWAKWQNPDWKKPDSLWVPVEQRGVVVPGGSPENPLVGWFLPFRGADYGIHGTRDIWSLGGNASSHGCVRMHPNDIEDLAARVPQGSIVHVT